MATSPATEDDAVSKTTLMPPAPYKEDSLTVRSPEPLPRKRRRVGPSPPPTPTPTPTPTLTSQPSNVSPTTSNVSPTLVNHLPTATPTPSRKRPHAAAMQTPLSPLPAPSTPEPSRKRRRPEPLDALRVVLPPPLDVDAAPLRCQITPPPSDRMLDHRNPPQPPRKAKKRRRQPDDVGDARPRPRLALAELPRLSAGALSPLLDVPPSLGLGSRMSPSSPALPPAPMPIPAARSPSRAPRRIVFRSLAAEFDAVANDDDDDDDQAQDSERSYRHRNVRLQAPPAITRVLAPVRRTDATTTASPTVEVSVEKTSPTNTKDVDAPEKEKTKNDKSNGDNGSAAAVTHVKPVPTRPSRVQDVPRFPCERRSSTGKRDQELP
ncbi:hypothetical protein PINS_up012020 [Pythium insidiosum]|nr:hypothetical protein PINS_up012020 [Pythium insidiosum]